MLFKQMDMLVNKEQQDSKAISQVSKESKTQLKSVTIFLKVFIDTFYL